MYYLAKFSKQYYIIILLVQTKDFELKNNNNYTLQADEFY